MSYNTQHCLNYVTQEIDYDIIADTIKKCGADRQKFFNAEDSTKRGVDLL